MRLSRQSGRRGIGVDLRGQLGGLGTERHIVARQEDQGREQSTAQGLSEPRCAGKEIYDQASLRHVPGAEMAIIGGFPDDVVTWTMSIAAIA